MKELVTLSSNFFAVWTEEKTMSPMVEVILILSEPVYSVDSEGQVTRERETSQARFSVPLDRLVKLAEALLVLAKESEEMAEPAAKEGA